MAFRVIVAEIVLTTEGRGYTGRKGHRDAGLLDTLNKCVTTRKMGRLRQPISVSHSGSASG